MKKMMIITLSLIFLMTTGLTAGATSLTAGTTPFTTRSLGMGGAFAGLADDPGSVIYNPAGLSQSGGLGLQFDAGVVTPTVDGFEDLTDVIDYIADEDFDSPDAVDNVQGVYDRFPDDFSAVGQAMLGANFRSFGGGINLTDEFSVSSGSTEASVDNYLNTEGIITLGGKVTDPPFQLGAVSYGVNLKVIRTDYLDYRVDTDFTDGNVDGRMTAVEADGSGFGLDFGVQARISDNLSLGATIRNLWAEEYELNGDKEIWDYDTADPKWIEDTEDYSRSYEPARTTRVGAALELPVIKTTVAFDIDNFPLFTEGDPDQIYHLGVEKELLFNGLTLRGGTFNDPDNDTRFYTAGFGLNLWKFHIDTSLATDDGFDDSVSGMVSARMRF